MLALLIPLGVNAQDLVVNEAAKEGRTAVVSALLRAGADVNAKAGSGRTALLEAAEGGHTATVRVLLAGRISHKLLIHSERSLQMVPIVRLLIKVREDLKSPEVTPPAGSSGDVPAAVEFGRVAAAPVNTLRQQTHRCQEISVCF